ncbi:MAG: methionine--tRNA ligase [Chlamydiae bacterium]|nr:methionine--tRNA ligase [Chlamydiota bacterium]MBI3276790.1 methionine--tRNA ligase [Chlamydiota bacterium]
MKNNSKNYFITTAIDYVNALPHLGTAYEKIGADVMARFKRLQGREVFFLMGVDEHSLNVEKEARKRNLSPQDYCDELAQKFEEVWKILNISYNRFIRTSSPSHVRSVQHVFQAIFQKGDIYLGNYEGWYCNSCEAFLKDKDLVEGLCPTHRLKPEWISEKNYFFALSRYEEGLKRLLQNSASFILPKIRHHEILNVIEGGLEDISVSRSGVSWGIPLPFDHNQAVYVWFDALLNYISAMGYPEDLDRFKEWWPAQVHVIGKDITRFHCVIWPAMLMSLGLEIPQTVFGHGFVYLKGEKMSKTTGTLIGPVEAAQKFGTDALRYFLMREIPFDRDGDFSWEAFETRYAADLANDLGNLIQRTLSMIQRYFQGKIPKSGSLEEIDKSVIEFSRETYREYNEAMESFRFSDALVKVWTYIQKCNGYIGQTAPWALAKDPNQLGRLGTVLFIVAESIAQISLLIEPFMPDTALKIRKQLGVENFGFKNLLSLEQWGQLKAGIELGRVEPLFPREEKKIISNLKFEI